jgi:hypothetical protein
MGINLSLPQRNTNVKKLQDKGANIVYKSEIISAKLDTSPAEEYTLPPSGSFREKTLYPSKCFN